MNALRKIVRQTLKEAHYTTWKSIEEGSPIDSFAGQQSEIVQKLAKHFDIKKTAPLGSGTSGFAYYIPNNRVLKITKDKSEAAEAFKIKGKKLKHLANIYDVYTLKGKYEGTYVIISELLNQTDRIDNADQLLSDFLDSEFGYSISFFFADYSNGSITKDEIKRYIADIKQFYKDEPTGAQETIWYMKGKMGIIDDIKNNGIHSTDWGFNNIGIKKDGNLAMYDLGYGDPNVPDAVHNIHLNETNVIVKDTRYETTDGLAYADVEKSPDRWHIEMIESKKAGNGTKIVNKIISDAKKIGVKKITLTTTEFSGFGFFDKLGFIEIPAPGIEDGHISMELVLNNDLEEYWSADEYPAFDDGQFNPLFHNRPSMPIMNMNTAPLAETEITSDEANKKELPLKFHYMWGDFIKSKGAAVKEIMPNIGDEAIANTNTDALIKDLAKNNPAIYDEFAEWIYKSLGNQPTIG